MYTVYVSINGGPSESVDYDLDLASALQLLREMRLENRPGYSVRAWYERQKKVANE